MGEELGLCARSHERRETYTRAIGVRDGVGQRGPPVNRSPCLVRVCVALSLFFLVSNTNVTDRVSSRVLQTKEDDSVVAVGFRDVLDAESHVLLDVEKVRSRRTVPPSS